MHPPGAKLNPDLASPCSAAPEKQAGSQAALKFGQTQDLGIFSSSPSSSSNNNNNNNIQRKESFATVFSLSLLRDQCFIITIVAYVCNEILAYPLGTCAVYSVLLEIESFLIKIHWFSTYYFASTQGQHRRSSEYTPVFLFPGDWNKRTRVFNSGDLSAKIDSTLASAI